MCQSTSTSRRRTIGQKAELVSQVSAPTSVILRFDHRPTWINISVHAEMAISYRLEQESNRRTQVPTEGTWKRTVGHALHNALKGAANTSFVSDISVMHFAWTAGNSSSQRRERYTLPWFTVLEGHRILELSKTPFYQVIRAKILSSCDNSLPHHQGVFSL